MKDMLDRLHRDGMTYANFCMPPEELDEMLGFLSIYQVWPAHVRSKAEHVSGKLLRDAISDREWPCFSPHMDAVVAAPHFMDYALRCLPIANEYFGEPARLYSVNAFWTQPATGTYTETHYWHRDDDDRKQLAMFLYGYDVPDSDAHLYQRGTHLGGENADPHNVFRVTGPAGTIFLEDPYGMHMGPRPANLRMLAWARFGVSDVPKSYVEDKLGPAHRGVMGARYPREPKIQEAIRLVVS